MNQETKAVLIKRLKALGWHVGDIGVVALIDFIATSLSLFNLPPYLVVLIGEILAQITKQLNARHQLGKIKKGV